MSIHPLATLIVALSMEAQSVEVLGRIQSAERNGNYVFAKVEITNTLKLGISDVALRVITKCSDGKAQVTDFKYQHTLEPGQVVTFEKGFDPMCIQGAQPLAQAEVSVLSFNPLVTEQMKWEAAVSREPKKLQQLIRARRVRIGMTQPQVRLSWGEPKSVNKTITRAGTTEQWVYSSGYLYFRAGRLDSMQVTE